MSASEKRIKEAFDEVKMPQGLKEATLEMIEKRAPVQVDPNFFKEDVSVEKANNEQSGTNIDTETIDAPSPSIVRTRRAIPFTRRFGFALAACLLLCLIGFGSFNVYAKETAVVGIELNPSIELGVNRFDIVVDARALNRDGEYVLSNVSVTGKSYDEALGLITQSDAFLSFIKDDSFVDVYVVCDDDSQSAVLVNQGQQNIDSLPCDGRSNRISSQVKSEADEYGMGVARFEAAQALIELDPSLTIEDCASMSMKELRTRIAELDPENAYAEAPGNQGNPQKNDGQQQGQGDGSGSGSGQRGQGAGSGDGQGNRNAASGNVQQKQSPNDTGSGQGQQQRNQQRKSSG